MSITATEATANDYAIVNAVLEVKKLATDIAESVASTRSALTETVERDALVVGLYGSKDNTLLDGFTALDA